MAKFRLVFRLTTQEKGVSDTVLTDVDADDEEDAASMAHGLMRMGLFAAKTPSGRWVVINAAQVSCVRVRNTVVVTPDPSQQEPVQTDPFGDY